MVYLDYAANTPPDEDILNIYCDITRRYPGNPNGLYEAGRQAADVISAASQEILELMAAPGMEVVYTSGASEANNLALKGTARTYRENGRHIISTPLEHSSVSGALTWLQSQGYEIDLLEITAAGTVDLQHLQDLMREDTILVSVCAVDSEVGIVQPIEAIREIVSRYDNCFFHVDATQAVGKIPCPATGIDLMTFAPHKFYGLNGMGVLLKQEDLILEPLIHGGSSTTIYRSGTPVPAAAAATAAALRKALQELEPRRERVQAIKQRVAAALQQYPLVRINGSTTGEGTIPHVLNASIKGVKAVKLQAELDQRGVYLSPKSACTAPGAPSRAVYAITGDRKNAVGSFRMSFSHLLTDEAVTEFLQAFAESYHALTI